MSRLTAYMPSYETHNSIFKLNSFTLSLKNKLYDLVQKSKRDSKIHLNRNYRRIWNDKISWHNPFSSYCYRYIIYMGFNWYRSEIYAY